MNSPWCKLNGRQNDGTSDVTECTLTEAEDAMSVTQDHLTCRRSVRLCPSVVDYRTRRRSVVNHFLNGVYSPTLSYRLQLCVFKKRDMPCRCWSRHRSKVFRDNNLIHITRKRTHNWHRQTDRQTDSRRSHVALYNRNTVAVNNVIKYVHMNTTRRRASIPPSDWRYFHQIFTMFFFVFFSISPWHYCFYENNWTTTNEVEFTKGSLSG